MVLETSTITYTTLHYDLFIIHIFTNTLSVLCNISRHSLIKFNSFFNSISRQYFNSLDSVEMANQHRFSHLSRTSKVSKYMLIVMFWSYWLQIVDLNALYMYNGLFKKKIVSCTAKNERIGSTLKTSLKWFWKKM